MNGFLRTDFETVSGSASRAPAVLCGYPLGDDVAMALYRQGMPFQPYVMLYEDKALSLVQKLACRFDGNLKIISVTAGNLPADFIKLAVQYRCSTKNQFALGYVVMHACEAVVETEVWLSVDQSINRSTWDRAALIAAQFNKSLFNPAALSNGQVRAHFCERPPLCCR